MADTKRKMTQESSRVRITGQVVLVFLLGYMGYFSLSILRKPPTAAKPLLKQEFRMCSLQLLSLLDNCYLLPYSLVAMAFPKIADTLGGFPAFSLSVIGASLSTALAYLSNYGSQPIQFTILAIAMFLSGAFQALGHPAVMKIFSEYLNLDTRKALIPIYESSTSAGYIVGGALMGYILRSKSKAMHEAGLCENLWEGSNCTENRREDVITSCGANESDVLVLNNSLYYYPMGEGSLQEPALVDWRVTYLIPSIATCILGVVLLCGTLLEAPNNDLEITADCRGDEEVNSMTPMVKGKVEIPSMWRIINDVPGVRAISIAHAFYKGAYYWFMYWCIDWLVASGGFEPSTAVYMSTALDIGCLICLLGLGPLISKNPFCSRPISPMYVAVISQLITVPLILIAGAVVKTGSVQFTLIILVLLGLFVPMASPIVNGIAPQEASDLDGRNLHGAVCGFVNGAGSFGALVLNWISAQLGSSGYGYALGGIMVAFVLSAGLTLLAYREIKEARRAKRRRKT